MKKELGGITYYDVDELSSLLDMTKTSIRLYIKKGRLEAIKIGRRFWVSEASFKDFLSKAKFTPDDPEA